jgi:putative transposase
MNKITETANLRLLAGDAGFDLIEERLRANVRATIEAAFEEELAGLSAAFATAGVLAQRKAIAMGTGSDGSPAPSAPRPCGCRARTEDEAGKVSEWRSKALPRYRRLTKKAEALIAAVYLAGTNTRRVKRALFGLFEGAVSKDVVNRAWRKVKVDWDPGAPVAWPARTLCV